MHHKRRSRRRDKASYYPCGCCVRPERDVAPVESEICNGKSRGKKARPKKEKCPVNGTHEWYKERVKEVTPSFVWFGRKTSERTYYFDKKTCIHCWVEKEKPVWSSNRTYRHSVPKKLPRRKVMY